MPSAATTSSMGTSELNVYTTRARNLSLICTLLRARVRSDVLRSHADRPRITHIIDTGSDQDRQRLIDELEARKEVTDRSNSLLVRYGEELERLVTIGTALVTAKIQAAQKEEVARRDRDEVDGEVSQGASEVYVLQTSTTSMRVERPTGRLTLACDYGSTWSVD
jgi:hypothetical protein